MAGNDPVAQLTAGKQMAVWLLRLFWPLPGAMTGAVMGFHLYFRQPGLNTDTVAPLIFASFWAFGGMLCGALCGSICAWLIQRGARSLFSIGPLSSASITLLCLMVVCTSLYAPLEARLPSLFWPAHQKEAQPQPQPSPCKQVPPSNPDARKSWELECR